MTHSISSSMTWLGLALLSLMLVLPQVAEAKRFGGGKSLGQQKSMPAQQRQAPSQTQPAAQPPRQAAPNQATSGASKWLGPLAGLAAGGLLAWMLFGEGFEGIQFMDIMLVLLIGVGIWLFLRARRRQATEPDLAYEGAQTSSASSQPVMRETAPVSTAAAAPTSNAGSIIGSALSAQAQQGVAAPSWFDAQGFLDGAKEHFVHLQQAWDKGDAAEIESYCTPALFAQLQAMMQTVVVGDNHTEVDTLYADIAEQSIEGDYFVVSVRFSGFIREARDQEAHGFSEIWHIRRLAIGEGDWQIAGIQQMEALD
ncbi:MAG: TIM44-like domain-containing protein [Thiomicrospira sp.]|nr:TIM44-like domain-containing protein [Thiomicrospira sp.]